MVCAHENLKPIEPNKIEPCDYCSEDVLSDLSARSETHLQLVRSYYI